ncbi:putative transcriptional regulator [Amycolatopsis bartoniae]|uniref:CBS domain-containing protein n=1 Tax=Amycolatopsis bartoniae TaxID=941986 RepID=A0A8H9M797_9PSEU|nr:CBS domain-containing protein [Amycolatopsis bartoniae]MBB2939989.1 putative transcriptional regulator [Amycolatopsis bartoniae]TVT09958.1 CBS domain-containing protein [Amycolatopsis bartoniae]GHF32184.1 hypothetical protein GCM10017566_00840 [Amycolatopsis bartoniae]
MHAKQMAEEFPAVDIDSDALAAARLLAEHGLQGLVVTKGPGCPHAVLPAASVVAFLVPRYIQDDPSLAGVLSESAADRIAEKLAGRTVRELLPDHPPELPVVQSDDTVVEVAATMARLRCPLVAVLESGELIGVITAPRLLEHALR